MKGLIRVVGYGEYIPLLGIENIIYIAGLAVLALALVIFKANIKRHEKLFTTLILVASLYQQYLLYSSYYDIMGFHLRESLPLHISRINSILGIIYLLTHNQKVFKIFAYFSLFAWTSFFYPSRVYGISHPIGVSFFLNHVITLLLPFYGLFIHGHRLEKGDRKQAFPWFMLYLAVAYVTNLLVDGNYFYLKYKPVLAFLPDIIYIPLTLIFTAVLFKLGEKIFVKVQNSDA